MATIIKIYCRDQHNATTVLCAECQALLDYAGARLARCRFGAKKPTCARCQVHCYQLRHQMQIQTVMRYAGPRMVWKHPVMTLRHWLNATTRLGVFKREKQAPHK